MRGYEKRCGPLWRVGVGRLSQSDSDARGFRARSVGVPPHGRRSYDGCVSGQAFLDPSVYELNAPTDPLPLYQPQPLAHMSSPAAASSSDQVSNQSLARTTKSSTSGSLRAARIASESRSIQPVGVPSPGMRSDRRGTPGRSAHGSSAVVGRIPSRSDHASIQVISPARHLCRRPTGPRRPRLWMTDCIRHHPSRCTTGIPASQRSSWTRRAPACLVRGGRPPSPAGCTSRCMRQWPFS